MDKIKSFRITGKEVSFNDIDTDYIIEDQDIQPVQAIEVNALRGSFESIRVKSDQEDDIIDIVFEDGTEWIGSRMDFEEIYGSDHQKRSAQKTDQNGEQVLTPYIQDEQNRGIRDLAFRLFNVFKVDDKLANVAGDILAEWADQMLMSSPGLYHINQDGNNTDRVKDRSLEQGKRYLLLIHGTFSSVKKTFKQLFENQFTEWKELYEHYEGRVLGLEHYTISHSPTQNVIAMYQELNTKIELDIISSSRGGIVADLLALCDGTLEDPGFSNGQLELLEQEDEHEYNIALELNELAKNKLVQVNRIFRVASPAKGTSLLSGRLDHFLNGMLRAIGLAFGDKANQGYQIVRRFLMKVIKSRNNAGTMPGLKAMMENSPLSLAMNDPFDQVNAEMFYLAGNATFGSLGQTILVILTKLYFRRANDMVVDSISMRYGLRSITPPFHLLLEGGDINHLSYFKNNRTVQSMHGFLMNKPSLMKGIQKIRYEEDTERGAVKYLFVKELNETRKVSGEKPIVFLLPGIMASNLAVDEERIWLDLVKIGKKAMTEKLKAGDPDVQARSVIKEYYGQLFEYLQKDYDVHVFPYDWRLSLDQSITKLRKQVSAYRKYNQPMHFVAHSMGGVVLRNWMVNDPESYKKLLDDKSRVILLGTPWLGSHHIIEVLTGHSRKLSIISWLSRTKKEKLLSQFTKYGGLYELLPMDKKTGFGKMNTWNDLREELKEHEDFPLPDKGLLEKFRRLEESVHKHPFDFSNVFYIAGNDKSTIFDYEIHSSIFGKKLRFRKTPKGDGSVTWQLGIPEKLPREHLYFTEVTHMKLANEDFIFPAIRDLIENGETNVLGKEANIARGEQETVEFNDLSVSNSKKEVYNILFGIDPESLEQSQPESPLKISVVHADLKEASYPVMVGHFRQDGIVSAERALDNYLDKKLTLLHTHSNYPEEIGSQEIILCPGNLPMGAIVVGLGDSVSLTSYKLSKTIEKAILKYILLNADDKDNIRENESVTSLCIGSGYAGLPMKNALISIIKGIHQANRIARSLNDDYPLIKNLEFIELYEDIANHAFHVLKHLEITDDRFRIEIDHRVKKEYGARKRVSYNQDNEWWHHFSTVIEKNEQPNSLYDTTIKFKSSGTRARVEVEENYGGEDELNMMLSAIQNESNWNKEIAKTLFEILVPNELKDIIRNQSNILWKMNARAAEIPWEMIHDHEYDQHPTFISAGLIRQLHTDQYRENPVMMRKNKALVISNLDYSGTNLSALPQAREEGKLVKKLLKKKEYEINEPKSSEGMSIYNSLFNSEFKILHIAGHGIYDPDNQKVGVVLGNGLMLTPARFDSLPKVPEFVFINCCYSGSINPKDEVYYQNRYKLAANLGVQLIKMGVEAVVVAGWAVNDGAARRFAEALYEALLAGNYFGDAVKSARAVCYEEFAQHNTWAAYQCYGNQWYQFTKVQEYSEHERFYVDDDEIIADLYNLKAKARQSQSDKNEVKSQLNQIISDAKKSGLHYGEVVEFEGDIYAQIDELGLAIDRFASLMKRNEAYYSVNVLEQYCHLRFKKLFRDAKFDLKRERGEMNADDIDSHARIILDDYELLMRIGSTAKRHYLIGIAYKYLAVLRNKNTALKQEYLQQMTAHYHQAYLMLRRKFDKSVYPLYNLVLAAYASGKPEFIQMDIEGSSLSVLLDSLVSDLETMRQNVKNRLRLRNLFNVNLTKYVISDENDPALEKHIMNYLVQVFNQELDYRFVNTESEHLIFLYLFFRKKRKFIKSIIEKFKEYK